MPSLVVRAPDDANATFSNPADYPSMGSIGGRIRSRSMSCCPST
jgi:hypothetical protein